jgi:L-alanine-DL-glutamate epimerase-like enolase superfamily enzyme
MKVQLYPYELPFRHTFTISRKSKSRQPLLVVKLHDGEVYGLGETADNDYYHMTVPRLMDDIEKINDLLSGYRLHRPEQLWADLYPHLRHNMFALCALDMAAWDLYAKKQGKKLYEVWGLDISHNPLTDYTIGIDSIENMVKKLQEFPWPIYKIKLGTSNDVAIIRTLRKYTASVFRVDANCAWTAKETIINAGEMESLGVEFIEQPLPADDTEGMKEVFRHAVLPVIADESCITEDDVDRCAGYFHGINIKLTKCGGITPALRMITRAEQSGMKIMAGSMNESTVGTSAIAHLLPYLDYADIDGPLLLAEDTADGVTFDYGKIIYTDRPGTGALLK